MGAHLRSLVDPCDSPGCDKRATDALYNTFNSMIGRFCKGHAQRALVDFQHRVGEIPTPPAGHADAGRRGD